MSAGSKTPTRRGAMAFALGVGVVGATVLAMASPATAVFTPATGVKVGVGPSSIAVADFNGDGTLDLAVANAGSGTVSVVLSDGFGLWRLGPDDVRVPDPKLRQVWGVDRPREWWSRPIPRSVVAADFNGDGKADFAITNEGWNTVSVRLGNGDGSFTAAPDVGVGQLPVSAVVSDFNADGKPDLAVANSSSNNVSVRLGDGAGNFTAAPDVGATRYPSSVALGDFNGDAKPDLAIANYGGERRPGDGLDGEGSIISVRLSDGAGGFTAAPDAYASPPVYRWQSHAASVAVGDFNADAKADLAVVDDGRNAVAVSWGDGGGNFAKPIDVWRSGPNGSTGEWGRDDPSFLTVADFEGDGASDLAVVNSGSDSVSVPVGHPGSLVDGGCLEGCRNPDVPVRNNPRAAAVADFNGDGKPDLVTANNDSDTSGTLSVHFSGYDASLGLLRFHAATDQRAGVGTGSVATADFNGDGRLDLVASNTFSNSVSLLLNDGIGFWRRGTHGISVPDPWGPSAVVTADFNGDGNADFATTPSAGDTLSVFLGNGAGGFTSAPAVSLGQGPSNAAVGDFNGDGKPDLAVTHYFANTVSIRLGDGAGNFTAAPDVAVGGGPRSVAVGDFNADGKADLAAANKSGGASGGGFVSVRLGDGTGRFTAAPDVEVSRPVLRRLSEATAVAVGDFNGDAKADLAVADHGNNAVPVLLGDGAGNFTLRTDTAMQDSYGRQGPDFVAVGDFNRDGASDLAVVNSRENSVSVPLGWGDGTFSVCDTSRPYACVPPSQVPDVGVGRYPRAVAIGDFNGDGKPDLATANNESSTLGTVSVHLNGLPDQTAADTTITATPPNPSNSTSATFSFTGTDPGGGGVRFDCRLDDAEYFTACTSPMTYSGLAPGSHTVQVRAIDAAGNADFTPASFTWTIDTLAPDTTITGTPSNPSNSTEATFTFTGDGTGTAVGFECKLDTGEFSPCTSPKTYSSVGGGSHTVQVRAVDAAGNVDPTPASFTWTILRHNSSDVDGDGRADLCVVQDQAPTGTGRIELHCSSGASNYQSMILDVGAAQAFVNRAQSSTSFADVDGDGRADFCVVHDQAPTGAGRIEVHCSSGASNYQSSILDVGTAQPFINRAQSSTSFADVDGDGRADFCVVHDQAPTGAGRIEVHCSSGASNYQSPILDVGAAQPFINRAQSSTALADVDGDGRADLCVVHEQAPTGAGRIEVHCSGAASNYQSSMLDVGAVQGYIDRAQSWSSFADVDGDGRADFCVVHDQAPTGAGRIEVHCSSAASNYQSSMLDVGAVQGYIDRARSWSVIGNRSTREFAVTDTSPADTTLTATPSNPSASTEATFTFTGDGTGSAVARFECKLDTGEFTACTSPKTYSGLAPGSHTVQVRAVDAAGNVDLTPASFTWTISIDTSPADTTITASPPNSSNSTEATFSFTGDGTGSEVAHFECKLDDGSFSVCTSPKTYSGLAPGSHTVQVRAVDAAGNVDPTPASFTWTISIAPVAATVTVNQAAGQADPTASRPINFTASFSSDVTGFTGADVSFTGSTAPGKLSAAVTGGPSTYNVAVSGMTGGGTVVVSIPANVIDGANKASSATDNSVIFSVATRPGIVRSSTERYLKFDTATGGADAGSFSYGAKPLTPLSGDWDGNGTKTPGTFEAGVFKLRNTNNAGLADVTFTFGDPRGFPVAGDFNGDGVDDVAVFRNGLWQVRYSTGETPATFTLGSGSWPMTVPVAGDWDGDGTDGVGVFVAGTWTLRSLASAAGVDSTVTFGPGTSPYPVVGDWNGDGIDTVGVKAGNGTTWRLTNATGPAPPVEITFDFGQANTDLPIAWR